MSNLLEIEIAGPQNESLHFRPLGRNLRGRFDLNAETEPLARMKIAEFPRPIPGQRLGIDVATAEGYITEPLHEPEHAAIRERLEARGLRLPPARETFPAVDIPTWLHWLKSAVESGIAKVVQGVLPAKIEGEPKRSFITKQTERPREDRLVAALERQNALIESLLTKLTKG